MKTLIRVSVFLMGVCMYAQTGIIKGIVKDKQSETPLFGVSVQLLNNETIGTITDENGFFVLENVQVGRQGIKVTYLGYENFVLPTIEVTSGKDVFLTINLQESFEGLDAVIIESKKKQSKSN